jgi:hypothetical protein
MKSQTKQMIGFAIEIFGFSFFGYCIGVRNYNLAVLPLALAFWFAIWTGKQIKQEGREEKR